MATYRRMDGLKSPEGRTKAVHLDQLHAQRSVTNMENFTFFTTQEISWGKNVSEMTYFASIELDVNQFDTTNQQYDMCLSSE